MLEEIKTRLSIYGTDLDPTITGMIDDVVAFCLAAGIKYSQLTQPSAIGLIARGVADLWNYGAGDGKFSPLFHMRLNQLCIDASNIDGDLLLQEKKIDINVPGVVKVTPDDGYLLTGVDVNVDVPYIPLQEKVISVTENGTVDVLPDDGYSLSKVKVIVKIEKSTSDNLYVETL